MNGRRRAIVLRPGRYDAQLRRLCVYCDTPVPTKRHRWCGPLCVERYQIARGDQGAARRFLWRRDLGVCQLCQTSTLSAHDERWYAVHFRNHEERRRGPIGGQWEADHTVPIWEGGELAPENLRTLCIPCHRRVTAEGAARRAAQRKAHAARTEAAPRPLGTPADRPQDVRAPAE